MIPEYNKLDQHYEKPAYGSSLKMHTAGIAPIASMSSVSNVVSNESPVIGMGQIDYSDHQPSLQDQHLSGLHLHFKALLAATSGTLVLIAIGTLAFNSINAKINSIAISDKGQISASRLLDYKATALTDNIVSNSNLQAGNFESITGVGELAVGSIAPGFGSINTTNSITTTADINGANFVGSGAGLTNLNITNISSGTVADARLSTAVTLQGNSFNGVSQLVQTTAGGILPILSGANLTSINGTNISSGTMADARLSTNVTVQGNTFNGASQLVQLTAGGILPVLSGANLTALNGTNISSGTMADARLSANVALLSGTGPQTFTGNNKFTGTILSQNASNSTAAFQIQNAAGTAILTTDTTNSRVGIGTTTPSASLEVNNTAVPTGPELITNGDFSSYTPAGPELVTNGTFTGSASGWTLSPDATYNSGTNDVTVVYSASNPGLSTTFDTIANNNYTITFTISGSNSHVNVADQGGGLSQLISADGTYTYSFPSSFTGTDTLNFLIDGSTVVGDTYTLDNVSITKNAAPSNWSIYPDVIYNVGTQDITSTYTGGNASATTTLDTVAGNSYLITFNVSAANAGICIYASNNSTNLCNGPVAGDGAHSLAFIADFTGTDTIWFDDYNYIIGDTWTLDNVSIKQTTTITPTLKVIGYNGTAWLSLGGDLKHNTALGESTLQANTTGYYNTATGSYALQVNTTGYYNTATGSYALQYNTTGTENTANGSYALQSNTDGSNNTATGDYALQSNTTGYTNTATGSYALQSNTTGTENTANGWYALQSNTDGSDNTANGVQALRSNISGSNNTATGDYALYSNTSGNNNTATGDYALYSNTTGSNNTGIGSNSGGNLTTGSNNVAIGYNTLFASDIADNQLQIGAGISGDLALGTLKLTSVTNSAVAFQIQNTSTETLFTADTSGMVITVAGTDTSYASLTLTDTHFKSTQTTAPTIGSPANCGTSPSAVVTTGSTDTAGSFSITVGTGGASTTCDTVLTFNKPYAVAPKSIIIAFTQAVGGANIPLWFASISVSSTTSFTVKEASMDLTGLNHVAGDISSYYYWVVE